MTVLVVAQLNEPVILIVRPFAFAEECIGINAQRAEQSGNIPVMPADQNICAVRPALDIIDQLRKLVVLEPSVYLETEFIGERFEGKARAMTVAGILGGEELVKF